MAYYTFLFSPETHREFAQSDRSVLGFKERQKIQVGQIAPGDKLVCYVTKVSRWVGVFEVSGSTYQDDTPIFVPEEDPYILRFKIRPIAWLALEKAVPIKEDILWNRLSFTKGQDKHSARWTGRLRNSLNAFDTVDGSLIEQVLREQEQNDRLFPLSESEKKKLQSTTIRISDSQEVSVSIPEDDETDEQTEAPIQRESIRMQALLARIGERMNLRIWLPKSDRERVLHLWQPEEGSLLNVLPLNYDDTTLQTIENIDVLWIRRRSIVRAFEVEHTTSIYSGILRMADLIALQPNLDIQAHIVAPDERREKVLRELTRPVFALLERGPLAGYCSFLSYDSINELAEESKLEYMNAGVLEEYTEYAED